MPWEQASLRSSCRRPHECESHEIISPMQYCAIPSCTMQLCTCGGNAAAPVQVSSLPRSSATMISNRRHACSSMPAAVLLACLLLALGASVAVRFLRALVSVTTGGRVLAAKAISFPDMGLARTTACAVADFYTTMLTTYADRCSFLGDIPTQNGVEVRNSILRSVSAARARHSLYMRAVEAYKGSTQSVRYSSAARGGRLVHARDTC